MGSSQIQNKILLIVDTNIQRRSHLATKLRLVGHTTEVSDSGFQVISLLENAIDHKQKSYSGLIIVEDSEDMPGREIMLLVRNLFKDKSSFPILVLNRAHDPDDILLTIKEGANEYVVDFDNQSKVLEKVRKHIPEAH